MQMHNVGNSSRIMAHGHDPATKTMRVQFKDGATYDYHDVDSDKYDGFRTADSLGGHLHDNFIKTKHRFTRLEKSEAA